MFIVKEYVVVTFILCEIFTPLCVLSYDQQTDGLKVSARYYNDESDYNNYNQRNKISVSLDGQPTISDIRCHGPSGENGRCVARENCVLHLQKLNKYTKYHLYYCTKKIGTQGVCCPVKSIIQNTYEQFERSDKDTSIIRHKRETDLDVPNYIKNEEKNCGRNGQSLSEELSIKTWPWVVSIILAEQKKHHCGGTLISRYHVLSAAHCFVFKEGTAKKESILARLGEYDFKNNDETTSSDHELAALINHEDYDITTYENDISLLILKKPVVYNLYVQPICMPVENDAYSNRTATVVGWGHIKYGGPGSDSLQEMEVPIWQYASCSNNIAQTIFTTNLCAGDRDGVKDSCQGDSGGPLMIQRTHNDKKRWELAGIVSWGVKCAEKGKPGVYTQVNKYLDWIYENIEQ